MAFCQYGFLKVGVLQMFGMSYWCERGLLPRLYSGCVYEILYDCIGVDITSPCFSL